MKSIMRWLWPTEEQKKAKLIKRIEKLLPENASGYDLDKKKYAELKKIYADRLQERSGIEFVSYTKLGSATTTKENEILKENSSEYYNLWWPKKVIFRILQLNALHTTNPNQVSMISVILLTILCYALVSVPSIFGYAIYPIMLFLTVPLLRHVSLMKWYTLFNNKETRQIEIFAPILLGISLTIVGVIAKLIGTISIPFIAPKALIIAAGCIIALNIGYMSHKAYSKQFNLLFFMTSASILALALTVLLPVIAGNYMTLITNITLLIAAVSLCTGFYNLYSESTNKFLTLLCGLAIIAATITLSAALLNASCLFLLSPHLTFDMIASSLAVGILASITLYGCAGKDVKADLYVAADQLPSKECFGVKFNIDKPIFWNMMKYLSKSAGKALTTLAKNTFSMIVNTFSYESLVKVKNHTTALCSSAFKAASGCFCQQTGKSGHAPGKDNTAKPSQ